MVEKQYDYNGINIANVLASCYVFIVLIYIAMAIIVPMSKYTSYYGIFTIIVSSLWILYSDHIGYDLTAFGTIPMIGVMLINAFPTDKTLTLSVGAITIASLYYAYNSRQM